MAQTHNDDELKVFISSRSATCDDCHEELGTGAWITLQGEKGAICLSCADLDHLEFLPSGNTALTRRARKHSSLSAVVLKWSKARKRYERQGLLVQPEALEAAEAECLADEERRVVQRARNQARREELDSRYIEAFAASVRQHFPKCPVGRENEIAAHACQKYSGRIGRTSSAKALDENAVRLAVIAHIRHRETNYDALLARGTERSLARSEVADRVDAVLQRWKG